MTSLPSNVQTAFCSPCKTRNFGATPFSRNSFNCSLTYCSGFCLIICVPCSDIGYLLFLCTHGNNCHPERGEVSQRWKRRDAQRLENSPTSHSTADAGHVRNLHDKKYASFLLRQSIRIQQNFP